MIDAKNVRSSMIECSRCASIRRSSEHDVCDLSRYDARRVLESVLLLITLTMFSVCSILYQTFVFESKRHVNVITYYDKFEHDFSKLVFSNSHCLFFVRFCVKCHVNVII